MQNKARPKIAVAMSGGVDSSVVAAQLVREGYDVVGLFAKTWTPVPGDGTVCTWTNDRRDALRVAAQLDIPLVTVDAEAAYRQAVLEPWIAGYALGETPNPDVWCNRVVKFGLLMDVARAQGAQAIATGHYAIIKADAIYRGVDTTKDQSYFLWDIPYELISLIQFPIGHLTKKELRQRARELGLSVADKKDSQGVCLLGPTDIQTFLKNRISTQPGPIYDAVTKLEIGQHAGLVGVTIGQRHGLGAQVKQRSDRQPGYIIKIDHLRNALWVGPAELLLKQKVAIREPNWLDQALVKRLEVGNIIEVSVQVRYRQTPTLATLRQDKSGKLTVAFAEPVVAPAPGQSLVCYDGNRLLGGAIIDHVL